MTARGEGFGRWTVRLLAVVGSILVVLGAFGWWLSTRVLEAEGFADVAAKASQHEEVRDYIGDQASLRLARTSNFVSAARPVVSDAISAAVATPPVRDAVHDFVTRAHEQVFQARGARRVDVNAQEAAVTIRSALQTINPALVEEAARRACSTPPPPSRSPTPSTCSSAPAAGWRTSTCPASSSASGSSSWRWSRPGSGCGRSARSASRWPWRGVSSSASASRRRPSRPSPPTADPLRGDAVAVFIQVLTGRLVAAGQAFFVFGILLALAPGHDGGDLRHRVTRIRAWFAEKRTRPRWRFVGGVVLMALALVVVTKPTTVAHWTLLVAAGLALYVGIVICLRASGLLETDHAIPKLHKRQLAGVFAAVVVSSLLTATLAVQLVASATSEPRANPTNQGCNGFIELCAQPLNQIVWPASHNAMSSAAYNFLGAEHTITIPEQMNAGARFFMIDAYYGYEDNGLVRTNLAGGANREELRKERGDEAVRELDRLGALTGVADTSGEKQDLYFCHDFCELGAVPASQIFADIDAFLVAQPHRRRGHRRRGLRAAEGPQGGTHRRRTVRPRVATEPEADRLAVAAQHGDPGQREGQQRTRAG